MLVDCDDSWRTLYLYVWGGIQCTVALADYRGGLVICRKDIFGRIAIVRLLTEQSKFGGILSKESYKLFSEERIGQVYSPFPLTYCVNVCAHFVGDSLL